MSLPTAAALPAPLMRQIAKPAPGIVAIVKWECQDRNDR